VARFRMQIPIGVAAGGRPAAACEITPEGVMAAATPAPGQPPVYAFAPLAADSIHAGLVEANIPNPSAVATAIRSAMGQVQPRVKSLTLVVPDSAVRVFVLDFDTLPSRMDETLPVLRFRLRKSVPFDVEHAGISFQILSEGSTRDETQWKIMAAIMPGPVLAEYESVVRQAGFEPGVILPASLAAICAVESEETVLVVNLSYQALTTSIVSGSDLLLHRTIELPQGNDPSQVRARQMELQRSIAVAAAFFEDKLQVRPQRLLYSGVLSAHEFAEMLDDEEIKVGEVVPRPDSGLVTSLGNRSVAEVTGVLMGTK